MQRISHKYGFTLIELLVVIAIIAILAAILFPVFAQARAKARATTCLSNEKQMALGFVQYTQDFDETFPMSNDGAGAFWQNIINPYLKSGNNVNGSSPSDGVWMCPDYLMPEQGSPYAVNSSLMPLPNYSSPVEAPAWPCATLATLQTPGDTILIAEMGVNDSNSGPGYETYGYFDPEEDYWASSIGTAAGNYLDYEHYDLEGFSGGDQNSPITGVASNGGDCDATASQIANPGSGGSGSYPGCGMFPRYRHPGATSNFVFSDAHVKAFVRGRLSWYKNIYVQGQYEKQEIGNGFMGPY